MRVLTFWISKPQVNNRLSGRIITKTGVGLCNKLFDTADSGWGPLLSAHPRLKIFRYHPTLCVKRWRPFLRSNQVSLPSQILRLFTHLHNGFPNWPRYPRYIHRNTRQRSSRSSFWLRCQRSNTVAPQPLESPAAVALM